MGIDEGVPLAGGYVAPNLDHQNTPIIPCRRHYEDVRIDIYESRRR
jgi:hypothetical protein